tara:strand:+ start:233 stop:430 length:198 start_codon:yes stop_codon:yes gene_type:complete
MNKNQVAKRTKRSLRSKQKRKQRNIDNVKKKEAAANKKNKIMNFVTNLSKTKQKELLKSIAGDVQ